MRRYTLSAIVVVGLIAGGSVTEARAQSVEDLKQRIQELERSTREQIDALKRLIEQRETERANERRAQEERERAYQTLKEQVDRQQMSLLKQDERIAGFFDLQAGRKQSNEAPDPLGKDIQGNVYSSDTFKLRLGGSLRLHVQRNDTAVGESVAAARLPDTSVPRGGNSGHRETFRAFAGRSRVNLAAEGPEALGGKTLGFFEMDFEPQFTPGEEGAVENNARLRHAFARWIFENRLVEGDEFRLTLGQTASFADATAETVDFNTMLDGLGAVERRNPRIELVHKYPLGGETRFVSAIGLERPFFGKDFIDDDIGPGDLSGFPALSAGIGLETGRLGRGFGIGNSQIYARTTWGEFVDRFDQRTLASAFGAQTNFTERRFTNQAVHGSFNLERIGFNKSGPALTLQLLGGGVWTRGEAQHLLAGFDRRVILDQNGRLVPAESLGGFINPIFYLTDTLSLRWAGGTQWALDADRPVLSGSLNSGFFRVNNRQSEVSIWWTPGPFTFALAYNYTKTHWRSVFLGGGSESRENENNKIEFISWFSF